MLEVEKTALAGLLILTPRRFGDARGFFAETWNRARFADATGVDPDFVQDNHSLSAEVGTIRGLHYQAPPKGQGKLVRCGRGALWDVALDIRRGSPTYGRWIGVELSEPNTPPLVMVKVPPCISSRLSEPSRALVDRRLISCSMSFSSSVRYS